jgi:hypothetical protein
MRPRGTTVENPTYRRGQYGFSICSSCRKEYTSFGIARHWGRCPKRGQCYKHNEGLCQCQGECAMQGKRVRLT